MTASVGSASMTLPDAGANVSSKTAAEPASDDFFAAVLSGLMPPSNAAPADAGKSKAGDTTSDDAAATIDALLTFAVAQAPWMAQIGIAPSAPPVPAPADSPEDAGPNSQSGAMPNGAPPNAAPDEPLRTGQALNDARAASADDLRPRCDPMWERSKDRTISRPSAGAKPAGEASAQPRGTPAPDSEAHVGRETKRSGDTKQTAGAEDNPVAAATSESAPDPTGAAVSDSAGNAAASTAPGAAPDVPLVLSGKDDQVAIAPNMRPEIASAIALANLTQHATRQTSEPARLRNGSTNAPEGNFSQPIASEETNHKTQPVRSAPGAMTADAASGTTAADRAPDHNDGTANAPAELPAKKDAGSPAPDDTSRNTAVLPHAASAEPATAPNPAQGSSQFPTLLDRAATDMASTPALNGSPNGAGAPVKLSFPMAASAPDTQTGMDALAVRIAVHSAGGDRNFSIRLDPPEFGHVEVNLNVNAQGHAQAELRADRPQTLDLLQKDSSVLERALKDAGLNLAGGLSFSLKGDGRSGAWRDSQTPARERALQIAPADAARATAGMAGSAALAAHAYGFSSTRLDIRV